jgi:hypothetical protein
MTEQENDKAPFFNTWGHWYVLLIVFQLLLIILFSIFTKRFL